MRFAITLVSCVVLSGAAHASPVVEQVKALQRTEKQVAAAVQAADLAALKKLDVNFPQQLQKLLTSDASFECQMAGNAMQGLLISLQLPPSARKLEALDHDAGQWERNMGACERELRLPSKRLITR